MIQTLGASAWGEAGEKISVTHSYRKFPFRSVELNGSLCLLSTEILKASVGLIICWVFKLCYNTVIDWYLRNCIGTNCKLFEM